MIKIEILINVELKHKPCIKRAKKSTNLPYALCIDTWV